MNKIHKENAPWLKPRLKMWKAPPGGGETPARSPLRRPHMGTENPRGKRPNT